MSGIGGEILGTDRKLYIGKCVEWNRKKSKYDYDNNLAAEGA